jgi:hypothetical protein
MDIKKWAGSRLGYGAALPAPGDPTGPVIVPQGGAPKPGMYGGMYGPSSAPLFNPGLKSADLPPTMAQWAQAGGTAPEHPMGPMPPWAQDQAAFQHALSMVKKTWEAYEEPWAVVAMVYDCMAASPKPATSPSGMPSKAPMAPGAPVGTPKAPAPPGGAPNPFAK